MGIETPISSVWSGLVKNKGMGRLQTFAIFISVVPKKMYSLYMFQWCFLLFVRFIRPINEHNTHKDIL